MDLVSTTQLYHCNTKAAKDNTKTNRYICVPIKNDLQKQVEGQIWPEDPNWLNPGLGNGI